MTVRAGSMCEVPFGDMNELCDNRDYRSIGVCDFRHRRSFDFRNYAAMPPTMVSDQDVRQWLQQRLQKMGRGAQTRLADYLGLTPTKITRMLNATGEQRAASASELLNAIAFFGTAEDLPGPAGDLATTRQIPIISWVSAGTLGHSDVLPVGDAPTIAASDLGSGDFFALRVTGDSMNRISPDGSIIVVDRGDCELLPDRFYVFSLRGEATYKRWAPNPSRLEPYSTNETHRSIFPADAGFYVVGRVRRTLLDL